MTQADRMLSMPPRNTPVDTTRRRFLFVAAFASVVGAGSLAVAAMASNDVPKAVTVPKDGANVSPALRTAMLALYEAHDLLIIAQEAHEEAEAVWSIGRRKTRARPAGAAAEGGFVARTNTGNRWFRSRGKP
jgi:hypothetical protein